MPRTTANGVPCNALFDVSIEHHNYLGKVPDELKDLTVVEEAMNARCRAKSWIIQLKEDEAQFTSPNAQRGHGIKGHVIYPQEPSLIASMLPSP
ncbi:hypothetical protein BJ138DRAFT_1142050 [Hygrophoropsis aurantiaca]|uniref:Uncharacterized protein n=1 Tax=Hygrophoropsis aurantiaca TaxID=72124 RepID=A0ACB8AQP2_9AGAM|nr:hypothetical protein BJ138DRAFT_1142050 [Hygrophoropsis aurantiaca]